MRQKVIITILTIIFACAVTACKADVENTTENSGMLAKDVSQGNQLPEDYNLHYVDGIAGPVDLDVWFVEK